MDAREQRGLEIAAKARIERNGNRWSVPSQSGYVGVHGAHYIVTPDVSNPQCTCPDHETRNVKCKHIWAVEFVIQREFTFDEETNTETVTETVTVKQTYSQEWSYNQAQCCEKEKFVELLADLWQGRRRTTTENGSPCIASRRRCFRQRVQVVFRFVRAALHVGSARRSEQGPPVEGRALQLDCAVSRKRNVDSGAEDAD